MVRKRAIQILTAGRQEDQAQERGGHGVFTDVLLRALRPVETTSVRALTTEIFRRATTRPGVERAKALREAMLELIDPGADSEPTSGRTRFTYAHPIFWAPFSLIGDGG